MNLRDYAQKQRQERAGQNFKPQGAAPPPDRNPIAAAQKIIAAHKLSHEIAEGCRLQILKDIENKENPYRMLLCAAEAISRLDYAGDTFFLQVQSKLIEVYGKDPSEDKRGNL